MLSRIKTDQRQIQLALVKTKLRKAINRVRSIVDAFLRKVRSALGYLVNPKTLKKLFQLARLVYTIYRLVNMVISVLGNLL